MLQFYLHSSLIPTSSLQQRPSLGVQWGWRGLFKGRKPFQGRCLTDFLSALSPSKPHLICKSPVAPELKHCLPQGNCAGIRGVHMHLVPFCLLFFQVLSRSLCLSFLILSHQSALTSGSYAGALLAPSTTPAIRMDPPGGRGYTSLSWVPLVYLTEHQQAFHPPRAVSLPPSFSFTITYSLKLSLLVDNLQRLPLTYTQTCKSPTTFLCVTVHMNTCAHTYIHECTHTHRYT